MFKILPEGIIFSFYVVRMVVELGRGYPLMFEMCKHQPRLLLCAKKFDHQSGRYHPEGSEHINRFMLHARGDLSKTKQKREQKRIRGDQELGNYGDVVSLHFCSYFQGGSLPNSVHEFWGPHCNSQSSRLEVQLKGQGCDAVWALQCQGFLGTPQQCLGTSKATPSDDQGTIWCQRLNPDYI